MSIRERVGAKATLMVKADAYGHGAEQTALATQDIVDGFGVATLEEGLALRRAGIKKDILTLICAPREIEPAVRAGLGFGLRNFEQIEQIERLVRDGKTDAGKIRAHIKVDTGMHRLGFAPCDIPAVVDRLAEIGVAPEGIYSHLRARSYAQKAEFEKAREVVISRFPNAMAHLAASGNLHVRAMQFDCVRIGIAAYRGAMTVASEVVEARKVPKGERISYGNFKAASDLNTAIVFGGYGDGVKRELPSSVYIRGRACKVLGRVCMDMFAVDTGDFMADMGEEVILFSQNTARDVCKQRRTIEYCVMTGWHGRVERIYVGERRGEEGGPR